MHLPRPFYRGPVYNGTLPNRPPDVAEWHDIAGGRLQWTPHTWVSHPLPHPELPARQFWGPSFVPWRGPGGTTHYPSSNPGSVAWLTGGHPLPGEDPSWSPSSWSPPRQLLPGQAALSPFLTPNPRSALSPQILWDVAIAPPSGSMRVTSRGVIVPFGTSKEFTSQATWPKVKKLVVVLEGLSLYEPITVEKNSDITIADIFNAVYKFLHKQLTQAEFDQIRKSQDGRRKCGQMYKAICRRCTDGSMIQSYMWQQGYKRVDILGEKTLFWGAYPAYNPDRSWYICISFMKR